MRNRLVGLLVGTLMFSAVAGLTAPPSFATTYFVKNLVTTLTHVSDQCSGNALQQNQKHGTVTFQRSASSMTVTVKLRGADSDESFTAKLFTRGGTCGYTPTKTFTTNGSGNADVVFKPVPLSGVTTFWIYVSDYNSDHNEHFATPEVPAHGY